MGGLFGLILLCVLVGGGIKLGTDIILTETNIWDIVQCIFCDACKQSGTTCTTTLVWCTSPNIIDDVEQPAETV